jgi:hypothetical protein
LFAERRKGEDSLAGDAMKAVGLVVVKSREVMGFYMVLDISLVRMSRRIFETLVGAGVVRSAMLAWLLVACIKDSRQPLRARDVLGWLMLGGSWYVVSLVASSFFARRRMHHGFQEIISTLLSSYIHNLPLAFIKSP